MAYATPYVVGELDIKDDANTLYTRINELRSETSNPPLMRYEGLDLIAGAYATQLFYNSAARGGDFQTLPNGDSVISLAHMLDVTVTGFSYSVFLGFGIDIEDTYEFRNKAVHGDFTRIGIICVREYNNFSYMVIIVYDKTPIEEASDYKTHNFGDLTISVPANWIGRIFGETGASLHDAEPNVIHSFDSGLELRTSLSVSVSIENWNLRNLTARQYVDYRIREFEPGLVYETDILEIDGVEVGMVTFAIAVQNYPDFIQSLLYFPHNGKEYNIMVRYESTDDEAKATIMKILNSIRIAGESRR